MIAIRRAASADLADIRALLVDARLPVEDLSNAAIAFFVSVNGNRLEGVVGLELFGDAGLLRSLAVQPDTRGTGLGQRLVEAAEAHARHTGVARLVLLTQTAAPFFAKRGYAVIERHAAPASVQGSAEFRSICPASAVCMSKSLGAAP